MTVASAQLHEAVVEAWSEEDSLDDAFNQYWSDDAKSRFLVLNDTDNMAAPETTFPFAVFSIEAPDTTMRMSGVGTGKFILQDTGLTFKVNAKGEGSLSAKEVAAALAERVLKRYGGHPTEKDGEDLTMDNGEILLTQFLRDYGVAIGDDEYMWTIEYNLRIEMPIAAG